MATDVAGIKEDLLLKPLQKVAQMSNVMFISRCGDRAIDPKISGFGAVDDVGKRPISLWHKQTPGILGVDFYPDRLYNIL